MHPLTQRIASLQRRLLWRRRATAACAVAATAIAAALVLGGADYVVRFHDPGLRIMATLALFAAIVWAVYRWAYLPSRRRLAPLAVARRIEQRYPQLKDSLASAVEFLTQSEEDPTSGSAQLRCLVVGEAQNAVDGLSLDEVIDRRPLRRAASWLAAVTVLLAACAVWNTGAVTTVLARLAAPLGSIEWPRNHYLAFRNVPTRLAAGQTFEVTLVDTGGPLPDDVRIEYRITGRGGTEHFSEPMLRVGVKMVARRENVRQSFAFRAVGGDDRAMRWQSVEVIEPPRLESLSIVAHPAAYTALPAVEAERHIEVLEGTAIEVRGTASKPLGAARILFDGMESIPADIAADKTGKERRGFRIAPGKWFAAKSGPYRLELDGLDGLAGVVGSWNLQVQPDSAPTATWVRPTNDLYVTSEAVVPIEVVVKDNLAIRSVELVYERANRPKSDPAQVRMVPRVELYRGPEKATSQSTNAPGMQGDIQTVTHDWNLAPLNLHAGAQFTLHVEAADYRPGVGRTPTPRRITVISADELEARLADLQTRIVRQLERALSLQQSTREEVRGIQIQLDGAAAFENSDRNTLRTTELNQRQVTQLIADPAEGLPALVAALLEQVEINSIASTDTRESMSRLTHDIEQLSAGPLSVAERELLAANKSVDDLASTIEDKTLSQYLSAAGGAQDMVIAALERLIQQLSGRAKYRQLARELAELRQIQLAHADATRADIGLETLPLQLSELTTSQRAELDKAASAQSAIARRYEKIERAVDTVASELNGKDDEARVAAKAFELARNLAIGADMREAARDLSGNRVGRALAREAQIAEKLQQLIDALRGHNETGREGLAENLREAERYLEALRGETAALRKQLAQTEGQGNAVSAQRIEQLKTQQDSLQHKIEELAALLDRLQASDAGQSVRNAGQRLDNQAANANSASSQPPRPASSAAAQAAEQNLELAAQQLANRRQQAEDDLALEFVRRFQAELAEMVKRQQMVINETIEIEAVRRPKEPLDDASLQSVATLADEEHALAQLAREHSELLHGLAAVRISLIVAGQRLTDAAELLENRDTSPNAQHAERHALARLEDLFEAFAQVASEAEPNIPREQPPPQAAQQSQQPQRRPTFELLEVKMLRMLQADLNERTRQFKAKLEDLSETANENEHADLRRETRQLQAEQRQLSDLVEEMLNRDNEEGGPN